MKNKKNIIIIISSIIIMFFTIILLSNYLKNNNSKLRGSIVSTSSNTTYKDWSGFSTIENDYSYSTIIYTKDTKIYVDAVDSNDLEVRYRDRVENEGTYVFEDKIAAPLLTFKKANTTAKIIITNCAIDKDGKLISAVIDLKVDALWGNNYARFSFLPLSTNKGTQTNPDISGGENWQTIGYNQPIKFYLEANGGTVKANLTYYKDLQLKNVKNNYFKTPFNFGNIAISGATSGKSLNYAQVDNEKSIIATDINKINSFYHDIDISSSSDNNQLFSGKEGIMPLNGSTTLYYNKSGATTFNNSTVGSIKIKLGELNNGIYASDNSLMGTKYNVNGIWYGQSAEFLTQNVNGKYSFAYSGSGCGIAFVFFSPKGYEIDSPKKEVSSNNVSVGEEFNFKINQYIPNNYYTSVVDFSTVSNSFSKDNLLKKIIFNDKIDSQLTINKDKITITDISSNNLTSYFDISVEGNEVTATSNAKAVNYLKTKDAYNNTITLTIPVVYNEDLKESKTIKNTAKVITRLGESSVDKTNSTNEVQVNINPLKLTYDCTTNKGEAKFKTATINVKAGQNIDVSTSNYVCEKKDYSFIGWSTDYTSETVLNEYIMPNIDTTLYAIYKPVKCNTILTSSIYDINQISKTVNVPKNANNNEIIGNVVSSGTKTISNETIEVECDGQTRVYKINRYSTFNTGQNFIRYMAILIGIIGILAVLLYIRNKSSK